jgi:small multidrug resistance family-3 protein
MTWDCLVSGLNLKICMLKTVGLFAVTAVAEIVGCYLTYLWLKQGHSAWLLLPAVLSLAAFVGLLTWHPYATGRVYAAYGGVYVSTALAWLWLVDGIKPTLTDWLGVMIVLLGMAIILFGTTPDS